jgi:hypothetical protein
MEDGSQLIQLALEILLEHKTTVKSCIGKVDTLNYLSKFIFLKENFLQKSLID